MAKETKFEPYLPEQPKIQLRRLVSNVEKNKSREENGIPVEELIEYGTTGSYDLLTALNVQFSAFWLLNKGSEQQKTQARQILSRIDTFYYDNGITQKYILPWGMEIDEGKQYLQNTLNALYPLMEQELRQTGNLPSTTDEMVLQSRDAIKKLHPQQDRVIVAVANIIPMRAQWQQADIPFEESAVQYGRVLRAANLAIRDQLISEEKLKIPDEIIRVLISSPRHPRQVLPRLYSREFNKIALDAVIVEPNQSKFNERVLRYITALQRGNPLLMRMADGLFFISQHIDVGTDFNTLFKFPKYIDKIYGFQRWFAENMVMPALELDWQSPPSFDNQVSALFEYFDQLGMAEIGSAVYYALNRGTYSYHLTHPDTPLIDIAKRLPVVSAATAYMNSLLGEHRPAIIDRDVHQFLRANWEKIQASWIHRFGDTPKVQILIETVGEYLSVNLMELHTTEVLEKLEKSTGTAFIQRLVEREQELKLTTNLMWSDAYSPDYEVAYVLSPDIEHSISFSHNSFPEIAGFEKITFVTGPNPEDKILFALELKPPTLTISGALDPITGELSLLSLQLTPEQSYLSTFIHHLATASYHDIIYRKRAETGEAKEQQRVLRKEKSTEMMERVAKPRKKKGRYAPRKLKYHARTVPSAEPQTTTSDELQKKLQPVRRPKERIWIDPHVTYLSGAYEYVRLRRLFLEGPLEDRSMNRELLLQAFAQLAVITTDKFNSLPDRFQLEWMYDPLAGQEVNLQTWVKGHHWPKEYEGREPLPATYRKDYRGGRSALSSLNILKSWIIE